MDQNTKIYVSIFFIAMMIIFSILEKLLGDKRIDAKKELWVDLISFFAFHLFGFVLGLSLTKAILKGDYQLLHQLHNLNSVVKVILSLMLNDFLLYWVHRLMHKTNFLWRAHLWHHSPSQLYWMSGFRTSLIHAFFFILSRTFVAFAIFKLTPIELTVFYSLGILFQFTMHTSWVFGHKIIEIILVTPRYHRIHHEASDNMNSNYGFVFTLWDRFFGTMTCPEKAPSSTLGLKEPVSTPLWKKLAGI